MEPKTTTFGQTPEGLARLLEIGVEADGGVSPDDARERLLSARLAGPVPGGAAFRDLQAALDRLGQHVCSLQGKTLSDALLDGNTDLPALKAIKDYAKKLASTEDDEVEHTVAIAIYFAAISSALLFHDAKITSYSYDSLADALRRLVGKPWSDQLRHHFAQARQLCKKRMAD